MSEIIMNTPEQKSKEIFTETAPGQVVLSNDFNVSTEEFLQLFSEVQCFRTFSDKEKSLPGKNFNGPYILHKIELREENKEGKGIFFIPNSGGHKDDDITLIKAVFMDLDDVPLQPVLDAVASRLTPHAIVKSSPGEHHHIYWLVENFPVERFKPIQKAFIAQFGHDKSVINPSRVMRLPGYYNQKKEPYLTKVIAFNPEIPRYSEQQIIEGLGLIFKTEPTNRIVRNQIAAERTLPAEDGERNCRITSYAGKMEAKNSTYDVILNQCVAANKLCQPPMDFAEVEGIVKSIWGYREDRLQKLNTFFTELKGASMSDRISLIQDDDNASLLCLAKDTDPPLFEKIESLFPGKKTYLLRAMKSRPIPTLADSSGNQILHEIPGCPKSYPGSFEGFPIVDKYFYQQTSKGVSLFYYFNEQRQDEVCHTPIFITKRFVRDHQEAFLEAAWLEKDKWNYIKAPRGDFFNTRKIVDLADRNFPVGSTNAKALAQYLQAFEATYIDLLPEQQISFQMGWHGEAFLLGKECISSDSTKIEFQASDIGEEGIIAGIKTKGKYEKWLSAVKAVRGHPLPMIALYASFSAPLVKILEVPNLGVDFSGKTSTGKTITLRFAASVWGQPDEALKSSMTRTWDSTNVAVERLCEVLSDLPMILDDTKRANPKMLGSKLYLIISGQGRGRGSRSGLRETQSWRTILISSGEAAAVSYTQDAGARARILTLRGFPFGSKPNRDLVNKLNQIIKNNYGFAGRLWVQWLIENQGRWESFKERLNELIITFEPSNGVEARLAEKAAVIALTGELVHEALKLSWEYSEPINKVWKDIKEEAKDLDIHIRGARSIHEWAVAHSTSFWGQHETKTITTKSDFNEKTGMKEIPVMPHNGWAGKWAGGNWKEIYFVPIQLKKICQETDFDYGAVTQGLIDSKLGSPDHLIRIDGKRVACFKILKLALMGESSEAVVKGENSHLKGDW